jgi:hypothetical protein
MTFSIEKNLKHIILFSIRNKMLDWKPMSIFQFFFFYSLNVEKSCFFLHCVVLWLMSYFHPNPSLHQTFSPRDALCVRTCVFSGDAKFSIFTESNVVDIRMVDHLGS